MGKGVQAWSHAYLLLFPISDIQQLLQAGGIFFHCCILPFQLLHSPSQMSLVSFQLSHPPSQDCLLVLKGLHLPIQNSTLALLCLQALQQVLHLHKRNWSLSMYLAVAQLLLVPTHFLAQLQLTVRHK